MKKFIQITLAALFAFACSLPDQGQSVSPETFITDPGIKVLPEPVLPKDGQTLDLETVSLLAVGKYLSYDSFGEITSDDEWGIFLVPCQNVQGPVLNDPVEPAINHYFGQMTKITYEGEEYIVSRGYTVKGVHKVQVNTKEYSGCAWKLLVKPTKDMLDFSDFVKDMSEFIYNTGR